MWPDVNQCVNYAIKAALVELVDCDLLNMDNDVTKYCVSNICIQLAETGIQNGVDAWNAHRGPR